MNISVLIPFHNREFYLAEALASIAAQTTKDWQVILYDDGSTDKSTLIAEDWLTRNPGFLIREKENRGVGYARNRLLQLIDTPYAAWMDSDDWSQPERLATQKKVLVESGADICFSWLRFCKDDIRQENTRPYGIDISKYDSREGLYNNMAFATGLFKKNLQKIKFPELRRKEDVVWLTKLIQAKKEFVCVQEDLYHVRQHADRLTPKK